MVVGRGRSSAKVLNQYRVIGQRFHKKSLGRTPSTYKLKVRMQEISAVQEYVDVDMDDGSYKRADISRLLTDDEVKAVVGKLKRV